MNIPSIVKFLIVPISLLESRTSALDAAAVPAVTLSRTPISAVVIVVLSSVKEVSPVIVPVTAKFPEEVIAPQPNAPNPEIFPLALRTRALDAAAVPAVTPFKTPISAVVIVVLSSVKEVSPVIVPVILTPELVTLNISVSFTKVFTSLLVVKSIYS